MRILIVEDEPPIAAYIADNCRSLLGRKITALDIAGSLDQAANIVQSRKIDLCFLDLNLNGESGFDILHQVSAGNFHTIIISAHTDQAVTAFEYGVLDFVPKPFSESRFRKAIERFYEVGSFGASHAKYLSYRKHNRYHVLAIKDVRFFQAAGFYVEAHMINSAVEILDKTMDHLQQILPAGFVRIHRSFIVNIDDIESYGHAGNGKYQAVLCDGTALPLSRNRYKELHQLFATRPR